MRGLVGFAALLELRPQPSYQAKRGWERAGSSPTAPVNWGDLKPRRAQEWLRNCELKQLGIPPRDVFTFR